MNNPAPPWLTRTRILLGDDGLSRLRAARVCLAGLGAVGGYVLEGLVRSGVGTVRLVDFDTVKDSNRNRQLLALSSTVGQVKTDLAAARARDINPDIVVDERRVFAHADTLPDLLRDIDLVVDAIDSLNPKVETIAAAAGLGIPVYSALGAATRTDASRIRFGPLFEAGGCPLGRLVRKRLRRRGVEAGDLWCVYSDEPRNRAAVLPPDEEAPGSEDEYKRGRERTVLGSLATITGLFGLRLAHEVILRLSGLNGVGGIRSEGGAGIG